MRPSAEQSHLRYPLTRLLGHGGNVRVLRVLLSYGAPMSVSQLAAETGLTPQGVRLVLDGLVAQQLVAVHGQGRTRMYAIATEHPFHDSLKHLFAAEKSRWDTVMQQLRRALAADRRVTAAWLYGSVARGTDGPASDIDVAISVDRNPAQVASALRDSLRPLEDRMRVSVSVVALSEAALRTRAGRWRAELLRDARPLKGAPLDRHSAQRRGTRAG